MCYNNGQKVTRTEFIRLKNLEKTVGNYNFLNVGVHNGFMFQPSAIALANADKTDFELVLAHWGYLPGAIKTHEDANTFVRSYTTTNFNSENMLMSDKGNRSMWADAVRNGRTCFVIDRLML